MLNEPKINRYTFKSYVYEHNKINSNISGEETMIAGVTQIFPGKFFIIEININISNRLILWASEMITVHRSAINEHPLTRSDSSKTLFLI